MYWITKQGKFKRELSSLEGCEESSSLWDEGRLVVRHKPNGETT